MPVYAVIGHNIDGRGIICVVVPCAKICLRFLLCNCFYNLCFVLLLEMLLALVFLNILLRG